MILEIKEGVKMDPFYELAEAKDLGTIAKSDDNSCQIRGQLAQYAAELFNHQHRTHAFQLFIAGDFARFLYWDRAGAVVSDRFDYVQCPEILAEFIWRYNHMLPSRRGWDSSVTEPSATEVQEFRLTVTQFLTEMKDPDSPQRWIKNAEDTLDTDYPPYKMTVGAVKTGKTQDIIIQKPFEVCKSPTGRSTRAYLAYSLTSEKIIFMKDSWRVEIQQLSDEDSIYAALEKENVPFIPKVLCAGDVFVDGNVQRTCTQEIARRDESTTSWKVESSRSRRHLHHRLLQELAYPVSTSANSKEYCQAYADASISKSSVVGYYAVSLDTNMCAQRLAPRGTLEFCIVTSA